MQISDNSTILTNLNSDFSYCNIFVNFAEDSGNTL